MLTAVGGPEAIEAMLARMVKTANNEEFLATLKEI